VSVLAVSKTIKCVRTKQAKCSCHYKEVLFYMSVKHASFTLTEELKVVMKMSTLVFRVPLPCSLIGGWYSSIRHIACLKVTTNCNTLQHKRRTAGE
jgi:hypothetical protein